jgi:hypothetical protein
LPATYSKEITAIGGMRNLPIWKRTAAVIAKPNTQKHQYLERILYLRCVRLSPQVYRSLADALPSSFPSSSVGHLSHQLGVNEGPFYTWKKKDAHAVGGFPNKNLSPQAAEN